MPKDEAPMRGRIPAMVGEPGCGSGDGTANGPERELAWGAAPCDVIPVGLAVAVGACAVSDVPRKLSQAKVAQAAISTQRYLKVLSPSFWRATLKLTAIDYTG